MNKTDQLKQDVQLIQDVLAVRRTAFLIAFETNNAGLFHALTVEDDQGHLTCFEGILEEAEANLKKLRDDTLKCGVPSQEEVNALACIVAEKHRVESLIQIRDAARANVGLITSGEVCYSPATKSTEELMVNLTTLRNELSETEQAEEEQH